MYTNEPEEELDYYIPERYFEVTTEGMENLKLVGLTVDGAQLVSSYYAHKSNTNIQVLELPDRNNNSVDTDVLATEISKIKDENNQLTDYRKAFLTIIRKHAVSVLYLKENGQEAIFWNDSIGLHHMKDGQELGKKCNMPVLFNTNRRQKDWQSCFTDALVTCYDVTKQEHGAYVIKNILSFLLNNSKVEKNRLNEDYTAVKMPDMLLRTSQQVSFIDQHHQSMDTIVHKNESLWNFYSRYSHKKIDGSSDLTYQGGKLGYTDDIDFPLRFLHAKGWKYTQIIQIQFYLEQLESKLTGGFTREDRNEFIKSAKALFKIREKASLFDLAIDQLEKIRNRELNHNNPKIK